MWSPVAGMRRSLLAAAAALGLALSPLALGDGGTADPNGHLACTAPTDVAQIDRMLLRAGSPLAGQGATFVRSGTANDIDPRFLVAVAAHETLLETYPPARAIHNPFGLGPGIVYASEDAAITAAGAILAGGYLAEGRTTIATIAPKWAPVGAANDPTNLNTHWTTGVSRYYAALGGEADADIRLSAQDGDPACGAPETGGLEGSMVWVWDGRTPPADGPGATDGGGPEGDPARPGAFVFPVAARPDQPVTYLAPACEPDGPCAVSLTLAPGTPVVAAAAGTLRAASADEQAAGIGFWIDAGRDSFGYSALAEYSPEARDGAGVSAGQVLGRPARDLAFHWRQDGRAINPQPLLSATRPATH